MRAVCVTESRSLEAREVPSPEIPPSGHILVKIEACAVNHGDKAFLAIPASAGGFITSQHDIWGASAAGKVLSIGGDVPGEYCGKNVALYRSLTSSAHIVGLWSEYAQVPWTSCLILPDDVSPQDYSGSLVNVITAYAFIEEMTAAGHNGVVVTAGNAGTGMAMAALARNKNIPMILLVRSEKSREQLSALGLKHVLVTNTDGFEATFAELAEKLQTTAVFDGVGGELISRIAPNLPMHSTVWLYGMLAAPSLISISSTTVLTKNLTIKRFSNFNSATVKDEVRLAQALGDIQRVIADPLFKTRIGRTFGFEQIQEAMDFESAPGSKAVLVANTV